MNIGQKCFVVNCLHEVRIEIKGRFFCFSHGEVAKSLLSLNAKFFEPSKNKKEANSELPKSDQDFILSHLDGCDSSDLTRQIGGISLGVLTYHLRSGRIKGTRKSIIKNCYRTTIWQIGISEMIRLIDLYRHWVTCASVARQLGESRTTFRSYSSKNVFGLRKNALGIVWIRKRPLCELRNLFDQKAKSLKSSDNYLSKKRINQKYLTAIELAKLLGMSANMVYVRIDKGWLKAVKHKNIWQFNFQSIMDFRDKAIGGKCPFMKNKTREKLQKISFNDLNALLN